MSFLIWSLDFLFLYPKLISTNFSIFLHDLIQLLASSFSIISLILKKNSIFLINFNPNLFSFFFHFIIILNIFFCFEILFHFLLKSILPFFTLPWGI